MVALFRAREQPRRNSIGIRTTNSGGQQHRRENCSWFVAKEMQVKPTTLEDGVPQQRTCAAAHGAVAWVAVRRRQDLLNAVVVDVGVSVFNCKAGEASRNYVSFK